VKGERRRLAFVAPFGLRAKGTTRARVLPLAQALAHLGHTVAVFIPPYDSPEDAGRRWREAGVEVVNVALPAGAAGPVWHAALAWRLLRAVRAWQPDLVHAFKPKGPSGLVAAALSLAPASGLGRPPLVMDSDDWEGPGGWNDDPRTGYSPLQKRVFAWQERHGLSHAAAWTVTSERLRQRAVAFGAAPEKIFILHNGVERGLEEPARVSLATVAAVSTVEAPSALLYTRFAGVRAAEVTAIWARVRAARPDAHLTVVGRGVAGEERGLAQAPGVTVAGWVEPAQLPEVWARAQVALVPWDDTPPNQARHSAKVLELMAAGLPIVAYAVGELPATLGDAGVLVPPGDQAAFAREVAALLADAARRVRLGAAARARVAERFTWARLAQIALAAYDLAFAGSAR
jgi:glycosyltransferase involved in cell wall biosynthesis